MQIPSGEAIKDRLGPAILLAGRIALGGGLGLVSTMFSIGVAWGLFLFSGSQSLTVWLATLMFSAGVGAGAGSLLAWLPLDRGNNPKRIATALAVVGIGTLSAWLGYPHGSNREIECCAMSSTTPIYYAAVGATIGTNIAVISIGLIRKALEFRVGTRIQNNVV